MRSLRCLIAGMVVAVTLIGVLSTTARAQTGLSISPLRQYLTLQAGAAKQADVTIANRTAQPITVALSVQQFSVTDYTYNYQFRPQQHTWVALRQTAIELKPGHSQKIAYQVNIPANAPPGGYYFTIFATTSLEGGAQNSKVQAATVLYLTVAGKLHKTSTVQRKKIPWLTVGASIPFTMDVRNTGNTHFFIYASGTLQGLFTTVRSNEITHLLMPDTSRAVSATFPAPRLPGLYRATYGYTTDAGKAHRYTSYVAYIPLWSVALPIGVVWLIIAIRRHRGRLRRQAR